MDATTDPLTDAELSVIEDICTQTGGPVGPVLSLIATIRTERRLLADECDKYGLPCSASALETHLRVNAAFVHATDMKSIEILRAKLEAERRENARLREYAQHGPYCEGPPHRECTCGLAEALAAVPS